MANLNIAEAIEKQKEIIGYNQDKERVCGQTLTVPFSSTISGSRALIAEHQYSQLLPIGNSEPPTLGTGYENLYGDESSSIIIADQNMHVLEKISKFSAKPDHHYYLLVQKEDSTIDVIESKCYGYTTEAFGTVYNTDYANSLETGSTIYQNDIIRRSTSYDQYCNRQDGRNVPVAYICDEWNTEDSMLIAQYVADDFWAPLVHDIEIIKNENDIFLNWYGDKNLYKCLPDIGEKIRDGIALVSRKSVIREAPYMQFKNKLMSPMMSDQKYTIQGEATLVDIDIYCNNTDNISTEFYDSQLYYYYQDNMRFINEFVDAVAQYDGIFPFSRELKDMYYEFRRILRGDTFDKDKEFSNMYIKLVFLEKKDVMPGDKFADRFGGKGVISRIVPDAEMPRLSDGRIVGIVKNPKGVNNRENGGQLYELDLNSTSYKYLCMLEKAISTGVYDAEEAFDRLMEYINEINHTTAEYIKAQFKVNNFDEKEIIRQGKLEFLDDLISKGKLPVRLKPITDTVTIDDLARIIESTGLDCQSYLSVPIKDSNGNIRYVQSRRKVSVGDVYTYRLKQYGEEKFSVTSMSSTNLKNENSRSKANSNYKAIHSSTPIKQGDMELTDMFHMSAEVMVINLMILSLSPHGRRMVESMLTGDPFTVDIRLDSTAKNRSVEIINSYLKFMGLEFEFVKSKKQIREGIIQFEINKFVPRYDNPLEMLDKEDYVKKQEEYYNRQKEQGLVKPGVIMLE